MVELAENGVTVRAIHPREWYRNNGQWHDGYFVVMSDTNEDDWRMLTGEHASRCVTTFATDMESLFEGSQTFDEDLSIWDVSNVTNMMNMFTETEQFRGRGLEHWDVSNVRNMRGMFAVAEAFCADLKAWDVSSVTDMCTIFSWAEKFDCNLSAWDVSSVKDMSGMFNHAESFSGGGLEHWDVSNADDMCSMFCEAVKFDGDLSKWNTSKVTDMQNMFHNAKVFRGTGIESWDTQNVRRLTGTFCGAEAFCADLRAWNSPELRNCDRAFNWSAIRHSVAWCLNSFEVAGQNNWNARRRMVLWRRALQAKNDAALCFAAARDGRPLELAKRLNVGALAGGLSQAKRGLQKLSRSNGQREECLRILTAAMNRPKTFING